MKAIRIRIQRKPRTPMYAGRDCMVGHLDLPDMLRLQELREVERRANEEFREFRDELVARVKKEEKQDIVEAGGDFSTVEVELYVGRKYLVTWYQLAARSNSSDSGKVSKKGRKGAKEKK